jgi:hypothetical protein
MCGRRLTALDYNAKYNQDATRAYICIRCELAKQGTSDV